MAMSTSESIFKDDPFFNEARFLLPMQRSSPLSSRLMPDVRSLREDFFSRRAQLVQSLRSEMRSSLLNELCDGLPAGLFQTLDALRSSSSSPSTSSSSPAPSSSSSSPSPSPASPPTRVVSTAVQPIGKQDSGPLVINTRGFSPEDIRVTVSGRQLEVMATKRAEAADSASTASAAGCCMASAASARQQGFIQRVQLPEGVEPSDVTCSMGEDGLLRIETHHGRKEALEEPKEQEEVKEALVASAEEAAPVRYRTSLDFPITSSSAPAGPEVTFNKSL